MSRSLFWKITLPLIVLTLVSMSILGFTLVRSARSAQIDSLRSHLLNEAKLVADASLQGFAGGAGRSDVLDAIAKNTGKEIDARVTIIGMDGAVLGDSLEDPTTMENQSGYLEIALAMVSATGESTRYSSSLDRAFMYVAVPVAGQGKVLGIARVAVSTAELESSVNRDIRTIAGATALTALVVIAATALIARMITRPVRHVTRAVRKISSGQLDQRVPIETDDELGQLGRAFNEMSMSVKKMMAVVTAERSKLSTILSSIADGVLVTDHEGNIILTNAAIERQFGIRGSGALNQPLIEVIRDHEVYELLGRCLSTGVGQTAQIDSVGGRFLRVIAIPLNTGKPMGCTLLFQDLTEMRSLQTMRRELVGNISHELRTPLASLKAIVETLEDGALDDQKVARSFLERMGVELDRIIQTVAELTELSRIDTGKAQLKLEPVNMNSLVGEALSSLSPLAAREKVALVTDLADDLPPVWADRERIRQVVMNIVHNAIKFTPPGGKATVNTRRQGDAVLFSVSDTGTGISKDDLPHVFERFFKADRSRSGGGTGLGLAIASHIIQVHGGRIWVESEQGKGSTFSFILPLQGDPL
ncbi:MAG: HAMP domain-containing protein [Chloroflexi bacterium]|nr:HAMP domain-containing protein [Chloroflexota bacterium]